MSNKIRQLENKTTTIDKDQVAVTIVTEVQYQVTRDHTQLAFTQLRNPDAQMKSWIDNCLRSYATGHSIQQLFQSTNEAGDHIQDALQKTMSGYGYTIIKVLVTSILVPDAIRAAMNSRTEQSLLRVAQEQTSERNKIATTVQAEADATQMIRLAEAESRKKMILAQADAECQRLRGVGIAQERAEIAKGLQEACAGVGARMGVSAETAAGYVMATLQLDTLRAIGANNKATIMVPYATNPGELMRNTLMQAQLVGPEQHVSKKG